MPAPHRDLVRKAFGVVETEALGDRQIRVRVSSDQVDRSGDVVVQKGIDFRNFMLSKTVLWNHDQDHPVAGCIDLGLSNGQLVGVAQFPPAGVSAKADEVYGLAKAGIINAASIGFLPIDVEPVDGKNPRNGLRIATCELMEFSFVSVPANSGAEVLQRAFNDSEARDGHGKWTVSSSGSDGKTEVSVHDSEEAAATEAASRSASGEKDVTYGNGDPGGADKGKWQVTSTDAKGNREVTVHDTESDAAKEAALRASNGHTEVKYGAGDAKALRMMETKAMKLSRKGLYGVSQLAWLLQMLGFEVDAALEERAREGDDSTVPDQLAAALRQLGAALIAMTGEEVAELLSGNGANDMQDDCPILLAMFDGVRTKTMTKAGRKISAATDDAMRGHLAKVAQGVAAVQAGHGEIVKMLDAAKDDPDDPDDEGDEKAAAAAHARRAREVETLRLR